MIFLIQTINGKIKHDFSFTLCESIEFNNWLSKDNKMSIQYYDTPLDISNLTIDIGELNLNIIPIGSVEFVTKYLQRYYNITPKPINIPNDLLDWKFTYPRTVFNGIERDIFGEKFVKSNDVIKYKVDGMDFTGIYSEKDNIPVGNYQISDVIDIESEWRVFVYDCKIVGLQNYLGRFDIFPNMDRINDYVLSYTSQPVAYTLDVAITTSGITTILEIHNLFSCGFYGFSDHKKIPFMFSKAFHELVNKYKNNQI